MSRRCVAQCLPPIQHSWATARTIQKMQPAAHPLFSSHCRPPGPLLPTCDGKEAPLVLDRHGGGLKLAPQINDGLRVRPGAMVVVCVAEGWGGVVVGGGMGGGGRLSG